MTPKPRDIQPRPVAAIDRPAPEYLAQASPVRVRERMNDKVGLIAPLVGNKSLSPMNIGPTPPVCSQRPFQL
jgi:hypothetical protein